MCKTLKDLYWNNNDKRKLALKEKTWKIKCEKGDMISTYLNKLTTCKDELGSVGIMTADDDMIPSLKLGVEFLPNTTVKEEILLALNQLDETFRYVTLALEAHKNRVKAQYDKNAKPYSYQKGNLVLLYDQKHDLLGAGTLQPLWVGPYVVSKFLSKGAYEIHECDGIPPIEPRNGIYLKKYYS
eukprot:PITA_23261